MKNINTFITNKTIPENTNLKYLITIPCVNREERDAINIIDKTFESFEKSGLFISNIDFSIILFESGSNNLGYLSFIDEYKEKYNVKIEIINSSVSLDGNSNTLKMFYYLSKLSEIQFDFIIWMDDDVFVCKNFIENADIWIKKYANFSIFSSLYVPYNSFSIINKTDVKISNLPGFYGTCCTIFKPNLSKYVIPNWYNPHFERFKYNPDTRFRDSVLKNFPNCRKMLVSYPSLVQHMNIGSAIKMKKKVYKGHKTLNFIGEENNPNFQFINTIR